jgi:hypothetical protein
MKASKFVTYWDLRSQSIKLLRWRVEPVLGGQQLSLANRMHDFHPGDHTARRPKRFASSHGTHEPLPCPMVLLYKVVEILALPDYDRCLVTLSVVGNRCCVTATLINRDLLRKPLRANSLMQEAQRERRSARSL